MLYNHLLYIGLNGYAGSGKDTVAKMFSVIFNAKPEETKEELYNKWYKIQKESRYATFNRKDEMGNTICLAFADKLKKITSEIFAVPLEHFYNNKSTGWINVSGNFEYSEQEPWHKDYIITAEDYASSIEYYQHASERYWMSIRECLVYVGTYVLQKEVNKNVFINITENRIKRHLRENPDLKFVICTDVRFEQEAEFIRNKKGILINIIRNDVKQLDNIAEHDLDEENDYNFTIENDGSYEDLWNQVYDLVCSRDLFKNKTVQLASHDGSNNYLRLIHKYPEDNKRIYQLIPEYDYTRVAHNDDESIYMIDPSGGPMLTVGQEITYGELKGWSITRINTNIEPFGFFITFEKK